MRAGHIKLYCYHTILFRTVPTTARKVIISWDELHSLLMSDRISCCRPPYHSRFHLGIIYSFTAAKISLQRCKTDDYSWDVSHLDKTEVTVCLFVCFWRDSPQWARASSFTRFLDHTQRRTTVGRTPLDD